MHLVQTLIVFVYLILGQLSEVVHIILCDCQIERCSIWQGSNHLSRTKYRQIYKETQCQLMRTIINRQTNDLFPTHIKIRAYRESHLTKPRTKLNEQPTSNKAESDILNNVNTPLFREPINDCKVTENT